MIYLHTIENHFDGSEFNNHQFIQAPPQSLMESEAIGTGQTLAEFLLQRVLDAISEKVPKSRVDRMLKLLEDGDVNTFLREAVDIETKGIRSKAARTLFGAWEFDTVKLYSGSPPTLREQQENIWTDHGDYTQAEWRDAAFAGETTLGFWEWVEHKLVQRAEES